MTKSKDFVTSEHHKNQEETYKSLKKKQRVLRNYLKTRNVLKNKKKNQENLLRSQKKKYLVRYATRQGIMQVIALAKERNSDQQKMLSYNQESKTEGKFTEVLRDLSDQIQELKIQWRISKINHQEHRYSGKIRFRIPNSTNTVNYLQYYQKDVCKLVYYIKKWLHKFPLTVQEQIILYVLPEKNERIGWFHYNQ